MRLTSICAVLSFSSNFFSFDFKFQFHSHFRMANQMIEQRKAKKSIALMEIIEIFHETKIIELFKKIKVFFKIDN